MIMNETVNLEEDELSERRDEEEIAKRKKGRKNKIQQSAEQHFAIGAASKQSRPLMIDPMGRQKVKYIFSKKKFI